jgi:hypothetical protein
MTLYFLFENTVYAQGILWEAARMQRMFNQIEKTSYDYYIVKDAWYYEYVRVLTPIGSGSGKRFRDDSYGTISINGAAIYRAIDETLPWGRKHNIKIFSPSSGFLALLKNILKFIVPDTPPFDDWIPDSLFDTKELDEYSNQPIEVRISCDCPPGCCKVCCSKFPGFCCVKYTANRG